MIALPIIGYTLEAVGIGLTAHSIYNVAQNYYNGTQDQLGVLDYLGAVPGVAVARVGGAIVDSAKALSGVEKVTDFLSAANKAKNIGAVERSTLNSNVRESLEYLESKNFNVNRPGAANGRTYDNKNKLLPNDVKYKYYDVNPKVEGTNRGTERFVRGDNGKTYYTNDHYQSFTEIKPKQ